MSLFFGRVTMLEGEIENYLDGIGRAGILFDLSIRDYLQGNDEGFKSHIDEVAELESSCDNLRREIRYKLYSKMLIPESRGDVLSLIENIDNVIDMTKKVLHQIDIERPMFPDFLHTDLQNLAEASSKAVDYTVKSARAYFKDINIINDYINKVFFYEHEADKILDGILRKVFSSDNVPDMVMRMYFKNTVILIARVSDEAEAVCERLSVAAIKQGI